MKLAMIVIRPDMYYETSKALIDNGFFSMTSMEDNVEAMAEGGWLYDSLADIQDFYVSIGEMDPNIDFKALVDSDFLVKE